MDDTIISGIFELHDIEEDDSLKEFPKESDVKMSLDWNKEVGVAEKDYPKFYKEKRLQEEVTEEEKMIFQTKVRLEDGTLGEVVTCYRKGDVWFYYCHPCLQEKKEWDGYKEHLDSKEHQVNLSKAAHARNKFITKHVNDDLSLEITNLNSASCKIQPILDEHVTPVIGLEYLVESDNGFKGYVIGPQYYCLLCDILGSDKTILSHISSEKHYLKYFFMFFPTALEKLKQFATTHAKIPDLVSGIIGHVAARIETEYGRLKPMKVERDSFDQLKFKILTEIDKGNHFRETKEKTFEECVCLTHLHLSVCQVTSYQEKWKPLKKKNEKYFKMENVKNTTKKHLSNNKAAFRTPDVPPFKTKSASLFKARDVPPFKAKNVPPSTSQGIPPFTAQSIPPFNSQGNAPFNSQGNPLFNPQGIPPFMSQGISPFKSQGIPPFMSQGISPFKSQGIPPFKALDVPPIISAPNNQIGSRNFSAKNEQKTFEDQAYGNNRSIHKTPSSNFYAKSQQVEFGTQAHGNNQQISVMHSNSPKNFSNTRNSSFQKRDMLNSGQANMNKRLKGNQGILYPISQTSSQQVPNVWETPNTGNSPHLLNPISSLMNNNISISVGNSSGGPQFHNKAHNIAHFMNQNALYNTGQTSQTVSLTHYTNKDYQNNTNTNQTSDVRSVSHNQTNLRNDSNFQNKNKSGQNNYNPLVSQSNKQVNSTVFFPPQRPVLFTQRPSNVSTVTTNFNNIGSITKIPPSQTNNRSNVQQLNPLAFNAPPPMLRMPPSQSYNVRLLNNFQPY